MNGVIRSAVDEALDSILAQWNEAGSNWDTERLAALFTNDALFWGSKPDLFIGHQIQKYYEAFPVKSCRFNFLEMKSVVLSPNTVVSCGVLLLSQVLVTMQKLEVKLRVSLVLVKLDSGWKIVQHHVAPTKGFTAADLVPKEIG